jgi:uncharacterized protein YecE (DUF72 family)
MKNVLVGVAGWSYPDWRGCFYPGKAIKGGELPRISRTFDCVELNVCFYRYPHPGMAEGWLKAVEDRPDFLFTSKVPRELTHEDSLEAGSLRRGAERLLAGLRPLLEAGRLGAILLQFPFYFRDSEASRERIRRLVEAFRPVPTVVEVRHREFLFQPGPAGELATGRGTLLCFLEELGASLSNIDQPQGRDTIPPTSINTSPLAYVRLHGRNARGWFRKGAGRDEKYDYLYSMAELREWKDRIQRLEKRAKRTVVIFNNHFRAQAPANALELLHLLGRPALDPPAELLGAFPNLAELASRG